MKRRGQAIFLLLAVLMAMVALTFWLVDIRSVVMARLRSQDSGDAAALAAARWQAAGLNLCGELNLIQAYMLADDIENLPAAHALHELRQRVQLTTPMLAMLAAQEVAKRNETEVLVGAEEYLREVRDYILLDGFYDGAEEDLRSMLTLVIREPIYAFPLSPVYDVAQQANLLVEQDFYEAVLSRDWCWFWFNAHSFLQTYRSRHDFGQLPNLNTEPFYGLHLNTYTCSLDQLLSVQGNQEAIQTQLQTLDHPTLPPPPADEHALSPAQQERYVTVFSPDAHSEEWISWTTYDPAHWGVWEAMRTGGLPIEGSLREEFDYKGTSAAVSVTKANVTWLAVAKPFARFNPNRDLQHANLALGGFDAVRLIPVDAGEPGIRGFDLQWMRHLRTHVLDYYFSGTLANGCRYCTALTRWDNAEFRQSALDWLQEFGTTCRRPKPGSAPGGGARYAH